MAVDVVLADDLGLKICNALGIDMDVERLILDLEAGKPVRVYVKLYATKGLLDVDFSALMNVEAEVVGAK